MSGNGKFRWKTEVAIASILLSLLFCVHEATALNIPKRINVHVTDNQGTFSIQGVETTMTAVTYDGHTRTKIAITDQKGNASFKFINARPAVRIVAILRVGRNIIALRETSAYCPRVVNNVTVRLIYM